MAISLQSLKTGVELNAPRTILYGQAGIGKTTFGAGCPGAVILPLEDGFGDMSVTRFPLLQSWEAVLEALRCLIKEDHKFQTIVIDTIDRLEKLIFAQVCKDEEKDSIEKIGYAKGYIYALKYWEELLSLLTILREKKHMMVMLIAHSTIKTFTPPDPHLDPYDVYKLDLHDKAANMLKDWVDMVLFAKYKVWTKVKNKIDRAKAVGEGERFIYTEERPSHWGKNRYHLPYELPFPKEGAWQIIQDHLLKLKTK